MDSLKRIELNELIIASIDGNLTSDQFNTLQSCLIDDPEAQRHYVKMVELCITLNATLCSMSLSSCKNNNRSFFRHMIKKELEDCAVRQVINQIESDVNGGANASILNHRPLTASWGRHFILKTAVIILLCLTVLWLDRWIMRESAIHPRQVVAQLIEQSNAQWDTDQGFPNNNNLLLQDRYCLISGYARIRFQSGVEVILESPAEMDLITEDKLFLGSGNLTAHVPTKAQGFKVVTPYASLLDLGTDFGVRIDDKNGSEFTVLTGEVKLYTSAQGQNSQQEIIVAGQARRVVPGSNRIQKISYDHTFYKWTWDDVLYTPKINGQIKYRNSPVISLEQDAWESDQDMSLILERKSVRSPDAITGLTEPGSFTSYTLSIAPQTSGQFKGKIIDSYLLHIDRKGHPEVGPDDKLDVLTLRGTLRFQRPILGVLVDTDRLIATDSIFGNPDMVYSQDDNRGITNENPAGKNVDMIALSKDRHTLDLTLVVGNFDEIRILVESP